MVWRINIAWLPDLNVWSHSFDNDCVPVGGSVFESLIYWYIDWCAELLFLAHVEANVPGVHTEQQITTARWPYIIKDHVS